MTKAQYNKLRTILAKLEALQRDLRRTKDTRSLEDLENAKTELFRAYERASQ